MKAKTYFLVAISLVFLASQAFGSGGSLSQENRTLYDQINAFKLDGGSATVENLVLKRDRVEMTFTGTFWFTPAVDGKVTGAVFIGSGDLRAAVPASDFEKAQVRRLIGSDEVASDFKRAVFRFTDDTFGIIGANAAEGVASAEAQKLADEFSVNFLRDTGQTRRRAWRFRS
ncbi:MAG: hypothetical protein J5I65_01655 [Aridibacter famidurans]|nr:hypothetical protein [Aridibacter famidurans]